MMPLHMEPGQIYNTWTDFKDALDAHCTTNKVIFNISNAKTIEQANNLLKKKPYFDLRLKYASCMLVCKHFGSYKSLSTGMRPKQRSYKINCKAFISVSACRKENYLIVRDSYHIHSHPCTDEIYNSYPEIRRMTKEERTVIGNLMEQGVPTSQLKSAVGRYVTPKDLQNAKTHIKAVKLGLKSDEPKIGPRRRKTYSEIQMAQREAQREAGFLESESEEDEENSEKVSFHSSDLGEKVKTERSGEACSSGDADNSGFTVTIGDINDHLEEGSDTLAGELKDVSIGDMGGLSGLLAAAGLSSDSVVLTVNNQGHGKDNDDGTKSSYTVTVSLPEGEVTHTGTNLQELLKGLPLGKIIAKSSSSTASSPVKIKTEENYIFPETKQCAKCGGYISPLDGHSQCLSCLGPDHIHEHSCEHCKAMTPEQFNIRRKKMVAMRMKALKEMRHKRKQDEHSEDNEDTDTDYSLGIRKSKRVRKPKNYGPDIEVENSFVLGNNRSSKLLVSGSNLPHFKMSGEDDGKKFGGIIPKTESLDEDSNFYNDYASGEKIDCTVAGSNTQRFEHILSQATVFEDVCLTESSNKSLCFMPELQTFAEFQKLADKPSIPAVPSALLNKYILHPKFESLFCADPEPLSCVSNQSVEVMGTGLCKLAKNAVAQARVAVYDKLFTRLGVGMADEALSILSELCSKVTEVTEISQEDLTSSLHTALDTIQALKDVLEELGVMSKDSLTTAAHQRSLSISSLDAARKSLKVHRASVGNSTSRRGKFLPFSRTQVSQRISSSEQLFSVSIHDTTPISSDMASSSYDHTHLAATISSSHLDTSMSELPIMTIATSQECLDVTPDSTAAFINMSGKEFTMAPLTVSSELLHSLATNKEGIIELHVLKDGTELIDSEDTTVEEVIQAD